MPEAASIAVPAAAEVETERRKISRQYSRPEDVKVQHSDIDSLG